MQLKITTMCIQKQALGEVWADVSAINIHSLVAHLFCCLPEDKQQKPPKVLEKFMGGKFEFENVLSIKLLLPLN